MHRMQVGLFGLCAMLLMVGLANVVTDRAKLTEMEQSREPATKAGGADAAGKPAGDPLADIGVVPGANSSAAPGGQPAR